MRICSIKGCGRKYEAKGFCVLHYGRFKKYGNPFEGAREPNFGKCKVKKCANPQYCKHFCIKHYTRFMKWGNPYINKSRKYQRKIIRQDGRVLIYLPSHPHTQKRGYVLRSRLRMEKYLGRYLRPEEIIHHKNGIVNDDRIKNLMLCKNQNDHFKLHNIGEKDGQNFGCNTSLK